MVKVGVALADHYLPDQHLRGDGVAERVGVGSVASHPVLRDVAVVAVGQNPAQQRLYGLRRDGHIAARGVVVPVALIRRGERVAGILVDARLDAVRYLPVIRADGVQRHALIGHIRPAAHEVVRRVPEAAVAIVGVVLTRVVYHVGLHSRRCERRECPQQAEAEHKGQEK